MLTETQARHEALKRAAAMMQSKGEEAAHRRAARVFARPVLSRSYDGDVTRRLLLVGPRRETATPEAGLPLSVHVGDVVANVQRYRRALLTPRLASLVELAAELHDSGKARAIWQRAVHHPDAERTDEPWGKSGRRAMDGRSLEGFRHEFASMVDALVDPRVQRLDDDGRDLLLHLIGSHHGYARPHFSINVHTHQSNGGMPPEELSPAAIARRFDRLQRRYGH